LAESLFDRALARIPGGVSSPVRAFGAVGGEPFFVARGEGAYLVDTDGRRYVDYVQSWGASILGHAHPKVVEAVQRAVREVGVCRQVGHSNRAERAHHRRRPVIQPRDEVLDQLEPYSGRAAREPVHDEQELRTHDVRAREVPLADAMLEDQPAVELGKIVCLDACPLTHADPGRQAVDRRVARQRAFDDCPSSAHATAYVCGQFEARLPACDLQEVVECERVAGNRDRHRG